MLRHKVTAEKVTKSETEVYQPKKKIEKSKFLYFLKLKQTQLNFIKHNFTNIT